MMTETRTADAVTPADCRHHWLLDADNQPEARGVCKLCGTERMFQNHLPGDRFAREWRSSRSAGAVEASRRPMRHEEETEETVYN